ncbi:alpha/beta fold hydrolase [Actinomycetospora sp.]|uniref:alpha/beta fold hydrolase n=1 Tax=Actinomycetospora sp. TaxID=1872135 RepID=UPI002F3E6D4B
MELVHDRSGSGEPLVLLHGLGHNRRAWRALIPELTIHRDVVVPDLPGHGDSPDLPDRSGDYRVFADAIEHFMASQGLDRPHVAGNSLGGLIALELAARGSVRTATALSPIGFWNRSERAYSHGALRAASRLSAAIPAATQNRVLNNPTGRAVLVGLIFGRPSRHDRAELLTELVALGHPREAFLGVLGTPNDYRPVTRPAVPLTIGWGTRDLLLPRRQSRRLLRVLPQARVFPLPGCGHVPMADDPDTVAELILAGSATVCA